MSIKKRNQIKLIAIVLALAPFAGLSATEKKESAFWVEAGASPAWQSRNDVQIPSDTGTRFSLSDGAAGPFFLYRAYVGAQFLTNHEVFGLWAPLSVEGTKQFNKDIDFRGATFNKNTDTDFLYKFNSYRLAYRYTFINDGPWLFKFGFTGKIRDADIRLTQGNLERNRENVGFVPLLHFYLGYAFTSNWMLEFYGDALWSPFGRAEDIALKIVYSFDDNWSVHTGYRTVEGGSDGSGSGGVYTFAWLHYFEVSVKYTM